MPPSSFASALAGNNQNEHVAREGSSEWARRTNGATHTFRRSSTATSLTSALPQPESIPASALAAAAVAGVPSARYVPPHRNGMSNDMRYSKDQLLDLYRAQQSSDGASSKDGMAALYAGAWRPEVANGGSITPWNRSEPTRDPQHGPDVCWDRDGTGEPLGLVDMDDVERELFMSSVNTPMKPPTTKDGQANGLPTRKVSLSGASGGTGPLSPSVARGSIRRRETSDAYPFPANTTSTPAASGPTREDHRTASPPPSLLRRKTDMKDKQGSEREEGEDKSWTPYGSLRRNPTAGPLSAGVGGAPPSPWSNAPPSAGLSPMGSFGNFGIGQQTPASDKRPGIGSGRSESRFKDLLSRDGAEDTSQRAVERKTSASNLARVNENESWRPAADTVDAALDEADEALLTGSAALGADEDVSPPHLRHGTAGARGFGTPNRAESRDDFGFGAFGMTSNNSHGFGQGFSRESYQQSPSQNRAISGNEPMSPTDTNPYQSPEQHGVDRLMEEERDVSEIQNQHLSGLGGFGAEPGQQFAGLGGLGGLPNLGRGIGGPGTAGDRSQTSSVGPNRSFPSLGGLGQLGGLGGPGVWSGNPNGLNTPGRQGFGSGMFGSSMGELQSPSLAGLGPAGPFGGSSRMSNMFSPSMQDPSQQGEQDRDARPGHSPFAGLGEQVRGNDGQFDEIDKPQDQPGQQLPHGMGPGQGQGQATAVAAPNQPPAPQQRTMVMPDRMRWIYRDPQGQTQGPWSGLEMHDWYKAGFFSPELLVKKLEDPEYEPLAQLIRRIGNSREPFLVPQIGIPHGQPSTTGPNAWAGPGSVGSASTSSTGAQPPFASSFPSFGTTLTAEQQNALERRKQEEQYLMARQKEHLAMAQRMHHPMPPGAIGGPHPGLAPSGQLHHQHSGQSLHSQPSFGSITSPTTGTYQPSPIQAPQGSNNNQGFFDNSFRAQGQSQSGAVGIASSGVESLSHIREEEIPGIMNRLNLGGRAAPGQFGAPGQTYAGAGQDQHESQVQQMLQDRARLQQEQESHDAQARPSEEMSNERLQQFQQLQNQQPSAQGLDARFQQTIAKQPPAPAPAPEEPDEELTLTEQVQKAASAQQSPAPRQVGLPQPFPPGPSQSPLPAPFAQRRGRESVADQLQNEQRDASQTPSVETPSAVAPWAKEPAEATKGPSLKEIQEMEAKKAAETEQIALAARRAALEKEVAQAQAAAVVTPGLPAASNWAAAGGSPVAATTSAAAWAKVAPKASGLTTAQSMAQIQKEEEARKRRVAAAALAASQANAPAAGTAAPQLAGGKSYANLAGKTASPAPGPAAGGAWTTVGAGGKTKTPIAPAPQATPRAVSSGVVPTLAQASAVKKAPSRTSTLGGAGAANAHDEFKKWAIGELRPDLSKGISAEDFVASLVHLPQDTEIITEAVHGVSSTIDSRHFAEEFVRRKKLADKGIVDSSAPPKSASPSSAAADKSGGWSEVAKKGPQREIPGSGSGGAAGVGAGAGDANGNFRVVAAKKKSGKR